MKASMDGDSRCVHERLYLQPSSSSNRHPGHRAVDGLLPPANGLVGGYLRGLEIQGCCIW